MTDSKKQPNLPIWFPSPKAWGKTIGLSGLMLFVVGCVRITGFWGIWLFLATQNASFLVGSLVVGTIFPFIVGCLIHHWITQAVPKKWLKYLPSLNSLKTTLTALIVAAIAIAVALAIVLPFAAPAGNCRIYYSIQYRLAYCPRLSSELVLLGSSIWCIVAAYLFHYDSLIRQRRMRGSEKRSQIKPPHSKPHPIDVELNQLRGQMGLTQMKRPVKKDHKQS